MIKFKDQLSSRNKLKELILSIYCQHNESEIFVIVNGLSSRINKDDLKINQKLKSVTFDIFTILYKSSEEIFYKKTYQRKSHNKNIFYEFKEFEL